MSPGPWLLPMRKKTVYTLEKLENILLAINVRSGRRPRPIIRLRILQGGIVVEGVQTIRQMPWYSRNCNTELLNDTIATTQKGIFTMVPCSLFLLKKYYSRGLKVIKSCCHCGMGEWPSG